MIDVAKITSGYDVELVLGEAFFADILRALIESGALATRWSAVVEGNALSLEIIPNYAVEITTPLGATNAPAVVRTGFQLRGSTPVGTFQTPTITMGIAFSFEGVPRQDGLIAAIALKVAFWDVQVDWQLLLPEDQRRFSAAIRGAFGKMLAAETVTGLSGGTLQAFAYRCYEATPAYMGAVGLYLNLPFEAEPNGTLFGARGNVATANCLFPSKMQAIAVAFNGAIYDMLASHIKNQVAYLKADGNYSFEIFRNQHYRHGRLGSLKSVGVIPRSPFRQWSNRAPWVAGGFGQDMNALFAVTFMRVNQKGVEGDLTVVVALEPELEEEQLSFSATVVHVDLDLDWEYDLAVAVLVGGLFGFLGGIGGGMLGFGLAAGIYGTLATTLKEVGISYIERLVSEGVQEEVKSQLSPLSAIPRQVTIVPRRFDPFYVTHYQIVSGYDSCEVLPEAITALGHQDGVVTKDVPYRDVSVIDFVKNEQGDIVELLYRVGKAEEILEPQRCRQPDGAPPDQFLLTLEEAVARKDSDRLRPLPTTRPTHVYRHSGKIELIKFDTGLVLTPHEAGQLEAASLIYVEGYDRIYVKRTRRFYFRSKPDPFEYNNLSALPSFEPE